MLRHTGTELSFGFNNASGRKLADFPEMQEIREELELEGFHFYVDREVLLLHVAFKDRIAVILKILERGWRWKKSNRVLYNALTQCALCDAPATIQCSSCAKVYCGHECLAKE